MTQANTADAAPLLVMVTANHPFVHTGGEVMFVGPELQRLARELAKAGAQVQLVPMHARGQQLHVPGGVVVDTSLCEALRRERISAHVRALFWPGFWAEIWRAVPRGGSTGCARVWRWAATASTTYRWACKSFPQNRRIVFYTFWRGGSTLALTRLANQQARLKIVTRVHRYELYEDAFDPPFQPWHPVMYQDLSLTAAVSQDGYDYLRRAGVPTERLMLSRLGCEAPAALCKASGDGVLRIVSVSFVTPVKRVPMIALALAALAARHPNQAFEWIHFGDGPQLDEVREAVVSATRNFTVKLVGHVSNGAVLAHYQQHSVDVFMLLSASEGLPVSIQEAASVGVPVIATDVGGVRELVGDDNGVLLKADASQADVVVALERVLLNNDSAGKQAMRAASRQRWCEGFDAEVNHTRFAKSLKRLFDSLPLDGGGALLDSLPLDGGGQGVKQGFRSACAEPAVRRWLASQRAVRSWR